MEAPCGSHWWSSVSGTHIMCCYHGFKTWLSPSWGPSSLFKSKSAKTIWLNRVRVRIGQAPLMKGFFVRFMGPRGDPFWLDLRGDRVGPESEFLNLGCYICLCPCELSNKDEEAKFLYLWEIFSYQFCLIADMWLLRFVYHVGNCHWRQVNEGYSILDGSWSHPPNGP